MSEYDYNLATEAVIATILQLDLIEKADRISYYEYQMLKGVLQEIGQDDDQMA